MSEFPFPGPTPAYTNPPIKDQYYQPSRFQIQSITLGRTTIITTTDPNNYVTGQLVRLLVPITYGTRELNEQQGYVISLLSTTSFELAIDSTAYTPFVASSIYVNTVPSVMAIGDLNSGATNEFGNVDNKTFIEGSFINISPQ